MKIGPPCPKCQCVGTAHSEEGADGQRHVVYDAPDPTCACTCHESWRMVNQQPAKPAAADAAA